ncbi:ABC-2 type transport system permease protein [Clostridium punense]|uniref:ABC-2 type transport system permease protein n=1 Tax=Clostridium punense TaxID=1054297 RepID=A0ABS4K6C8_9CLOT|nr:ABC transporter permease [Clostridium sp. BL8]EQB90401.1 hypothetical protein M918_00115 [Clostridium sp. BL8]MBP2023330.1 ABC-2 type transport system permease protein [Clostridium punense]
MFNLLKIEFYKLRKSKLFYFFVFLSLLQALVIYSFSESLKVDGGKDALMYMLFMQSSLASNIIGGVFAADFIVTEFTSGYIKNLISYGHKRSHIFLSKSIAYYVSILAFNFSPPLVVFLIATIKRGYGEVFTFRAFLSLLGMLLFTAIAQGAIASINVLIAFVTKNMNLTIGIVVGIDFAYRIISFMSIRNSSIRWVFQKLAISQPYVIAAKESGVYEVLQILAISLLTIALCIVISNHIFKKADIK